MFFKQLRAINIGVEKIGGFAQSHKTLRGVRGEISNVGVYDSNCEVKSSK